MFGSQVRICSCVRNYDEIDALLDLTLVCRLWFRRQKLLKYSSITRHGCDDKLNGSGATPRQDVLLEESFRVLPAEMFGNLGTQVWQPMCLLFYSVTPSMNSDC